MKLSKIAPLLLPLGLFGFAFKIYLDSQNRPDISGETQEYRDKVEQAKTQNRDDRELEFVADERLVALEQDRFAFDINEIRRRRDELRGPVDVMTQQTISELGNFDLEATAQWDVTRQLFNRFGAEYQEKSQDPASIKERFATWHSKFVELVAVSGSYDKEDLVAEIKQMIADGSTDPYLHYCRCECEYSLVEHFEDTVYDLVDLIEGRGYSGLLRSQILYRMLQINDWHFENQTKLLRSSGHQHQAFLLVLCTEAIRDAVIESADVNPDPVWPVIQEALTVLPMRNVKFVFAHCMEALPQETYLLYMVGGFLSSFRGFDADDYPQREVQMQRAAMYYHCAWLMDPQRFSAPQILIKFGDLGGEKDWNARDWFNVSLAINGTDTQPYWNYFGQLQSGTWIGGMSLESPLEFARECLQTDEFEAEVPNFYFEVLFSEYRRGEYLFDGTDIECDLIDAVDRLERWLQTEAGKSSDKDNLRKQRASMLVLLLRQGNWTDARRLCRMLPGHPFLTNPEQLLTDYQMSRVILAAVNHDAGEPLVYVEEKFGRNMLGDNSAESTELAIERVRTFGERDDLSEAQRQYVNYRMNVLVAERDYLAGRPAEIRLTGDSPMWWFAVEGNLNAAGDRAEMSLASGESVCRMGAMVSLVPPFVLRATVKVTEPMSSVKVAPENQHLMMHHVLFYDAVAGKVRIPGPKAMGRTTNYTVMSIPLSDQEKQLEVLVGNDTFVLKVDGEVREEMAMPTQHVVPGFDSAYRSLLGPVTVQRLEL